MDIHTETDTEIIPQLLEQARNHSLILDERLSLDEECAYFKMTLVLIWDVSYLSTEELQFYLCQSIGRLAQLKAKKVAHDG